MRHRSGAADPDPALRRHADHRAIHREGDRRPSRSAQNGADAQGRRLMSSTQMVDAPARKRPSHWQKANKVARHWLSAATGGSRLAPLLQDAPRPLINPDARLVVLFSPKSACTTVVMWFLHHLGHGQKARDYATWPHHYR